MSITIAIPVFNADKYLEQAVNSVLKQSHSDFELIILDDGSTDTSLDIANSIDDKRIRVISDGTNLGLPARLNQVVELAKYDLIARMDADDIIPLDRLEKQFEYLSKHPEKDLVSTGLAYIDESQVLCAAIPQCPEKLTFTDMINGSHGICHASLLVRKSWYQRNKYDANMHRVEDYELWLRAYLANDLNVGYLPIIGYYYRSDVTLSLSKFVNTYRGGLIVADKHNLSLNYKIKLRYKILASKLIFLFGLERRILSKLNGDGVSEDVKLSYQNLLRKLA
jgi:glycosyltransferase involved in cell wall biosynthesis